MFVLNVLIVILNHTFYNLFKKPRQPSKWFSNVKIKIPLKTSINCDKYLYDSYIVKIIIN